MLGVGGRGTRLKQGQVQEEKGRGGAQARTPAGGADGQILSGHLTRVPSLFPHVLSLPGLG